MDFLFLDQVHRQPLLIPALIAISSLAALLLNLYGLIHGITIVFPHLFYIPIILAGYYYPRWGVIFTAGISVIYSALVFTSQVPASDMISALERVVIFIIISAIVSILSAQMQYDTQLFRRLVSIIESSDDAVIGKTLDGIITDWNSGAERLYGYTVKEMIGKPINLLIPADHSDEVPSMLEKIRCGERIERYETEWMTKEGKRIKISLSLSPIKNIHGEIVGASSSAHNITDKIRMQDEILRAKNEWELTFDAVPDLIAIIDLDYRIVRVNRSMADRLGIQPGDAVGHTCYELVHHLDHPLGICPHSLLLSDEKIHSQEIREDSLNGSFLVTVSPLCDSSGTIIGSVHILHDITERKLAEEALRESRTYLEVIINTIPDPVFVKDRRHHWILLNDGFCQFIGHTRNELLGKSDYDFFPKEEADVFWQKDEVVFQTRTENENEENFTDAQGNTHTIITKKTLYSDFSGQEFIVGIIRDISERKTIEKTLQLSNKKLTTLASITRHDISNQLMGLRTFLELSKESVQDPELLGFIRKGEEAAEAIGRQIEFMRFYETIGLSAPQWQEITTMIRSSADQLHLEGIALDLTFSGVEIFADPLIEKVFYNLLENSTRHGGHVTAITVSVREAENEMILTYRDNGVGITAEDKKRLFQKGFGKHTGLGLFLSREILSITGLTVSENGKPGQGVQFEILVPKGMYRFAPTRSV